MQDLFEDARKRTIGETIVLMSSPKLSFPMKDGRFSVTSEMCVRLIKLLADNWSSPEKVDSGSASFVGSCFWFQSPQVIDSPGRCGAAEDYKRFRCNQRLPVGRFGYFQKEPVSGFRF